MKHLAVVCALSAVLALPTSNAFGWGAVTGPRGGAADRGPMGGAAVRGPYGGAVARGPAGGVAARGPGGGAAYRAHMAEPPSAERTEGQPSLRVALTGPTMAVVPLRRGSQLGRLPVPLQLRPIVRHRLIAIRHPITIHRPGRVGKRVTRRRGAIRVIRGVRRRGSQAMPAPV